MSAVGSPRVVGERYGRLVLTELVERGRKGKLARWRCRCDCGNEVVLFSTALSRTGNSAKSCGCLRRESVQKSNRRKVGDRYGRLVLVERVENNKHGQPMWLCKCDCGGQTVVMSTNLIPEGGRGRGTQSCGCLHREATMTDTPYVADFKVAHLQGFRNSLGKRLFSWTLTFEQYREIVTKPCHYCGAEPSQRTKNVGWFKNGIDRVDSSIGYQFDNCVPCCARCNVMKGAASVADFLSHVARIHKFSLEKVSPNV